MSAESAPPGRGLRVAAQPHTSSVTRGLDEQAARRGGAAHTREIEAKRARYPAPLPSAAGYSVVRTHITDLSG
jgi:hypothetical protein